jgi:hypothetical protein
MAAHWLNWAKLHQFSQQVEEKLCQMGCHNKLTDDRNFCEKNFSSLNHLLRTTNDTHKTANIKNCETSPAHSP